MQDSYDAVSRGIDLVQRITDQGETRLSQGEAEVSVQRVPPTRS